MSEWSKNLQDLRRRELEIAFKDCPEKMFDSALELGAGSGFQSALLSRYAKRLIATELNAERFNPQPLPGVEYKICDAERVGEAFDPDAFDLIFASNLMEHLPHPQHALEGMKDVLASGGIVILVMPNVLWKLFSLAGFYPNALRLVWRALVNGRAVMLWKRYVDANSAVEGRMTGNNLKSAAPVSAREGIFWPSPHGAYPSHRAEFAAYSRRAWTKRFLDSGFDIVAVLKGPVSSGYGFGFDALRRFAERIGLTTEYIYVLSLRGQSSPYARYWTASPSGKV